MTVKNSNGKRLTGRRVAGIIAVLVGLFVAVLFVSFEVLHLDQMQSKAAAGWIIAAQVAVVVVVGVISIRKASRR